MSSYSKLYDLCKEIECEYSTDVLLKDYTSFKIGGKAAIFAVPKTAETLASVCELALDAGAKKYILKRYLLFSIEKSNLWLTLVFPFSYALETGE